MFSKIRQTYRTYLFWTVLFSHTSIWNTLVAVSFKLYQEVQLICQDSGDGCVIVGRTWKLVQGDEKETSEKGGLKDNSQLQITENRNQLLLKWEDLGLYFSLLWCQTKIENISRKIYWRHWSRQNPEQMRMAINQLAALIFKA